MPDRPDPERFQRRIVASFYGFQLRELRQSFISVDVSEGATYADAINAMEPDETKRKKVALGVNVVDTLVSRHVNLDDVFEVLVWQKGPEATDVEYEAKYQRPRK